MSAKRKVKASAIQMFILNEVYIFTEMIDYSMMSWYYLLAVDIVVLMFVVCCCCCFSSSPSLNFAIIFDRHLYNHVSHCGKKLLKHHNQKQMKILYAQIRQKKPLNVVLLLNRVYKNPW